MSGEPTRGEGDGSSEGGPTRHEGDASPEGQPPRRRAVDVASVRRVRVGHGANCSSIGSVIDTLFATATLGAAVFAAVVAALESEEVTVVGGPDSDEEAPDAP
jgi:hypothetical protein